MHRGHLRGTIWQDKEAQIPVRILILWSGAVVPSYRQFFLELAKTMRVRVLAPHRWTHGSTSFGDHDPDPIRTGREREPDPGREIGCEILPVTYLPERSPRYWVPSLVFHLWAFRPRYLYIMDEMDRPSLAWHALMARIAWPPVRVVSYALQNLASPSYYRWHHRLATRINQALVSRSIAASREADAILKGNGYRKPTRVIPLWGSEAFFFPGEPEGRLAFRRGLGIPGGDLVLVYAGGMVEAKGLTLLREVLPRFPRLRVISAGNGPLSASLPVDSDGRWIHLGALEGEDLRRLYQAGDYVILPSLTRPHWKEQIGRSLIEGILCGCIALGSDSGHIPELTLFPQTTFRQGDAEALAVMLAGLPLADAGSVREAQGANVRARFTAAAVARATTAFLAEAEP
ncbi:MAG: putative glycosyltransferase [Fibrobacteres bacterium]|nr:putative glycosyltransferase [Fibrobacterota bacterium]